MSIEPPISQAPRLNGRPGNPYEGRWRWWYSAIADWMIRNPGGKMTDCARDLGKGQATIGFIVTTDLFRDYLAKRKEEWRERHDFGIQSRLTQVAEASLDILLEQLHKKKDQVPIDTVREVANTSLERLGYGSKPQQPSVLIQNNSNSVVVSPATAIELAEARQALRLAEARRSEERTLPLPSGALPVANEDVVEGEVVTAEIEEVVPPDASSS